MPPVRKRKTVRTDEQKVTLLKEYLSLPWGAKKGWLYHHELTASTLRYWMDEYKMLLSNISEEKLRAILEEEENLGL